MKTSAKCLLFVLAALMVQGANLARAGGTVVAWGYNYFGQTNVHPELTNVVEIAAGDDFSAALQDSGPVKVWGNLPATAGLSNALAIAGGGLFCLALHVDGTVLSCGIYYNGSTSVPMVAPSGLSNVVSIAAGHDHGLAVRADGTVLAWGGNDYGLRTLRLRGPNARLRETC